MQSSCFVLLSSDEESAAIFHANHQTVSAAAEDACVEIVLMDDDLPAGVVPPPVRAVRRFWTEPVAVGLFLLVCMLACVGMVSILHKLMGK